ncbi:MAG: ABC transporter ATP-binding protein, partial [Sphingobacteriaceae bacterium]
MAKETRNRINVQNISFKKRFAALGNLPQFFKLVWQSSPWKTSLSFLLRLVRSAMPVALLYVGKLIVDQVVLLNYNASNQSDHHYLWQLVAAEFGLALLTDALNRLINLLDSLLGDQFSNHTSIRLMRHAATLDLDQFEDSVFY